MSSSHDLWCLSRLQSFFLPIWKILFYTINVKESACVCIYFQIYRAVQELRGHQYRLVWCASHLAPWRRRYNTFLSKYKVGKEPHCQSICIFSLTRTKRVSATLVFRIGVQKRNKSLQCFAPFTVSLNCHGKRYRDFVGNFCVWKFFFQTCFVDEAVAHTPTACWSLLQWW